MKLTDVSYDYMLSKMPYKKAKRVITTFFEEDIEDPKSIFKIADNIYHFEHGNSLALMTKRCWREDYSLLGYYLNILKALVYKNPDTGFNKKLKITTTYIDLTFYRKEWFECARNCILRQ